jgi:hypothetical protein
MHKTRPWILPVTAATLVLLGSFSTKASAAPVTFAFDGDVTFVNNVGSRFSVGDDMTGSLTYDSELVDSNNASTSTGTYAPLSSLAFMVDGYTFNFSTGGSIEVLNGPPGTDRLIFTADVTGDPIGSFKPFRIFLELRDATGLVFSSDELPLAFDTSQFTFERFIVSFSNRTNPYDTTTPGTNFTGLEGTLSGSAVAASAPEPTTLTLLFGGLAAIGFRRRYKR